MKSKQNAVTGVRHLSAEFERTVLNGHGLPVRELPPSNVVERVVFKVEEHLQVHQQTERRAHELWCAGGCHDGAALNDWLQAEREVLEEFIGGYIREHLLPRSPRPAFSVGVPCRKAKTRNLKYRRAIPARDTQLPSEVEKTRQALAPFTR